jgi:hypothetical protein
MSLTWGSLIGLYILEDEPGWNGALLLGFAMAAGALLRGVNFEAAPGKVWSTLVFCLCVSLVGGAYSGQKVRRARVTLFPLSILYLLGWIVFSIFPLPEIGMMMWAVLGLLLFLLVGVSIFSRGKLEGGEGYPIPLASDLFVVGFNLFWLAAVFWADLL